MFFNFKVVAAFAASMAMASALPQDNRNYEVVTNALGYTTTRFKPGMGPGSEDYIRRFGNVSAIPPSENSLFARQDDGRTTSPFIGDTRIPYGCNTDIGNYVLSKLYDVCYEERCDGGTPVSVAVEYPQSGKKKEATVTLTVEGDYPSGYKDTMIKAIQALVPSNGVDYYDVTSYGTQNCAQCIAPIAKCEVVGSGNFFSVVVRNADQGQVARLDVTATFTVDTNDAICGTIATVAKEIAGAINGIAGAFFGIVQAVSCGGGE